MKLFKYKFFAFSCLFKVERVFRFFDANYRMVYFGWSSIDALAHAVGYFNEKARGRFNKRLVFACFKEIALSIGTLRLPL